MQNNEAETNVIQMVQDSDFVTVPEDDYALLTYRYQEASAALKQLRQEDEGWMPLSEGGDLEVNHSDLVRNANKVRAFSQMNPLLKRGKTTRAGYIFGDGVTITARSDGKATGTQDVEAVIHDFVEDNRNLASTFSTTAQHEAEHDLYDDGNVFRGHWVNPMTGKVQVRQISFEEITQIKTRPGDNLVPQFYLRVWTIETPQGPKTLKAWYPDLRHHPASRERNMDGIPILWPGKNYGRELGTGAAIYHQKVNAVGRDKKWGLGDGYAAMPWAKAYTGFITDWASLMKALASVSYYLKGSGGRNQLQQAANGLQQHGAAGGTMYGSFELETPNLRGASFDADSGRPLAALVAAALGISVTILTADPGSTGARAVAETLDKPQQNEMKARQRVHVSYYRAVCDFVIQQAVVAPQGPLRGTIGREDDQQVVYFRDNTSAAVDISMPELEDINTVDMVDAISKADATGKMPPTETLQLMLKAFGYDDIASIVDANTDNEGNWVNPMATVGGSAGRAAADTLRRGGNPADVL